MVGRRFGAVATESMHAAGVVRLAGSGQMSMSGSGQQPCRRSSKPEAMITTHTNPAVPLCTAQLGLFASDEMAIDTTFAAAHRIGLDATSWVEHVPG